MSEYTGFILEHTWNTVLVVISKDRIINVPKIKHDNIILIISSSNYYRLLSSTWASLIIIENVSIKIWSTCQVILTSIQDFKVTLEKIKYNKCNFFFMRFISEIQVSIIELINESIAIVEKTRSELGTWGKTKFANVIRSCRLSRALVPAKGAFWRDEISCVFAKRPKSEEFYLRIYTYKMPRFNRGIQIYCLSGKYNSYRFKNIASSIFFSIAIILGLLLLLFQDIFSYFNVYLFK